MVETADAFVVAVLADIEEPDPATDPVGYGQTRDGLARSMGEDLTMAFAAALRERAQPRVTSSCSTRSPPRERPAARPREPARRLRAGRGALVWTSWVADLETPVAAFLKLAHGRPNSFLLESVEGGSARGRYSIIGMEPDLIWRCRGGRAEINRHARSAPHAFVADDRAGARQPARADRRDPARRAGRPAADGGRPGRLSRLRHGAADGAAAGEEPRRAGRARGDPDAPDAVRHLRQRAATSSPWRRRSIRSRASPRRRPASARRRRAWPRRERALERPLPHAGARRSRCRRRPSPSSNLTERRSSCGIVERMKEYIAAGDAFQVVPSQRFSVPFALPPFALYRALRRINPAPFLFFLDFGGFAIVGCSPEILVRLRDGIGDHPPARRHAPPRRHAGGGPGAGGRAAGRPEGARRAPDAARSRPQRCRPRRRARHACR